MDVVTRNQVNSFAVEESLSGIDDATLFEHFVNFSVISSEYGEEFDIEDVHTGGGDDLGIDGLAILVNGVLVADPSEVEDLAQTNRYVEAEYIFCQAKSSSSFDGTDISNFFFGVKEFFTDPPTMPRNATILRNESVSVAVYGKSPIFKRGNNPTLRLYYVTTGNWQGDKRLQARIDTEVAQVAALNIFETVEFFPIDARTLQKKYNRAKNRLSKTITFADKVTLPTLPGVQESYLGYLPVSEYLSLITDDSGSIVRGLFYDNVRDYQGSNPVNKEIAQTLQTDERDLFVLLNNGVTVVADSISKTGNVFTLEDYQVVNGCQTSHVLFENSAVLSEEVRIPLKLIVSADGEVKNRIIKATNRQTVVKTEELTALTDFQKSLEDFYAATDGEFRLYYERRSQQYRSTTGVEKMRIVTVPNQIRAFASMFLGLPHRASRYYGTLLNSVEDKIFLTGHPFEAYYASALALYRLESMLRKKTIDPKYRPFKYQLLALARLEAVGADMPQMTSRKFAQYCTRMIKVLSDDAKCTDAFDRAISRLDAELSGDYSRDRAKDAKLLSNTEAASRTP